VKILSTKITAVSSLKEGSYIIIDGEPCKIIKIEKSKPGKHGAAKAHIVAVGVFDGAKRSIIKPVDAKVEVPIINKKSAQVISVNPLMLMDLETYETFEVTPPDEEDVRSKLKEGVEVEYWEVAGKRKIMRVK